MFWIYVWRSPFLYKSNFEATKSSSFIFVYQNRRQPKSKHKNLAHMQQNSWEISHWFRWFYKYFADLLLRFLTDLCDMNIFIMGII